VRILLVGRLRDRATLRPELEEAGIEIAGEFDTLARAQGSTITADAILLTGRVGDSPTQDEEWIVQPLTPRELEVLQLLSNGLSNKSVAERLGISDQTVKFHVASISSKLGASNRTEAVRLGLRRGLINL
jgi:DNA-binding NarL/FixJ family response regulator